MMTELSGAFETIESKMNFMKGCIRLAKADGLLGEEEQNIILTAAKNLGLQQTNFEELLSLMTDKQAVIGISFENKKQSILFFLQAIELCYADGDYSDSERAEIEKISNELGVLKSAVDQIEEWVIQGRSWMKAGESLVARLCS